MYIQRDTWRCVVYTTAVRVIYVMENGAKMSLSSSITVYIQLERLQCLSHCSLHWQSLYWSSAQVEMYIQLKGLLFRLTVLFAPLRHYVALWCITVTHQHNLMLDCDTCATVCCINVTLVYTTRRYFILDCNINVTVVAYIPQSNNKKVKK